MGVTLRLCCTEYTSTMHSLTGERDRKASAVSRNSQTYLDLLRLGVNCARMLLRESPSQYNADTNADLVAEIILPCFRCLTLTFKNTARSVAKQLPQSLEDCVTCIAEITKSFRNGRTLDPVVSSTGNSPSIDDEDAWMAEIDPDTLVKDHRFKTKYRVKLSAPFQNYDTLG